MRFGEVQTSETNDNQQHETVVKVRNGEEVVKEETFREWVQVMRVSDLDDIINQMHIEHALTSKYGAWLEKQDNGTLYVVKYWSKREAIK